MGTNEAERLASNSWTKPIGGTGLLPSTTRRAEPRKSRTWNLSLSSSAHKCGFNLVMISLEINSTVMVWSPGEECHAEVRHRFRIRKQGMPPPPYGRPAGGILPPGRRHPPVLLQPGRPDPPVLPPQPAPLAPSCTQDVPAVAVKRQETAVGHNRGLTEERCRPIGTVFTTPASGPLPPGLGPHAERPSLP